MRPHLLLVPVAMVSLSTVAAALSSSRSSSSRVSSSSSHLSSTPLPITRVCSTRLDTVSHAVVPTTTNPFIATQYQVTTVVTTAVPTVTVTPSIKTLTLNTTITLTIIIGTQSTDTYTSTVYTTSTLTSSSTTTLTSTTSVTTVSTTSTTTTVPTPAGFTALANQADYSPLKARSEGENHHAHVLDPPAKRGVAQHLLPHGKALFPLIAAATIQAPAPQYYAAGVTCAIIVQQIRTQTSVVSASSTVTKTLAGATETVHLTVTASAAVSTTLADTTSHTVVTIVRSTTSTSTVTASTTTTLTNTVIAPAATFYAQCAAPNLVSSAHGLPIGQISYSTAFQLVAQAVADTSGYGCCAACAQTPDCAGFGQYPQGGACYFLLTQGQCDGSKTWGDQYHYFATLDGFAYVVGNGACGALAAVAGEVLST